MSIFVTTTNTGTFRAKASPRCSKMMRYSQFSPCNASNKTPALMDSLLMEEHTFSHANNASI